MKYLKTVSLLVCITALTISCGKKASMDYRLKYQTDAEIQSILKSSAEYPEAKFVVISDPHYFDTSLGVTGEAFNKYLDEDRKLLHLSEEILDSAINKIRSDKPDFIIIPGDLTKDGEKINHEIFSKKLGSLSDTIPNIYVIPGNHDINNNGAVRYIGSKTERIETVTPEDFRKIYRNFGYNNQVEADKTSLSYVAEPVKGLWLLALDSCLWREHTKDKDYITDGEFSEATLRWLEEILIKSKVEKKALIAFMHHGAMEHYPENEKFYGEYVVNNDDRISDMFKAYGVKVVFTGHYHAQDITMKKSEVPGRFVYDIETGSLITHPSPYRIITIDTNQKLHVESRFITAVKSKGEAFKNYSEDFLFKGTVKMGDDALKGYKVSEEDMAVLSPRIAKAYMSHLSGDEVKPDNYLSTEGLGILGKLIMKVKGGLLEGWYTDLAPADNFIIIDLKTGDWEKSSSKVVKADN